MNALQIVQRRRHDIQMETDAPLRISASATFLNALLEECPEVSREGYDFAFEGVVVRLDPRLGGNSFLIELVPVRKTKQQL